MIICLSYALVILLLFIYILYGYLLSKTIDYIFPSHNDELPDYRIALEVIAEIGLAYLIYFLLYKYSSILVNKLYNNFSIKTPYFLNEVLLIGFSCGVFKSLNKSVEKSSYIHQKYKDYFNTQNIINYYINS
jgi:hypothetical protein